MITHICPSVSSLSHTFFICLTYVKMFFFNTARCPNACVDIGFDDSFSGVTNTARERPEAHHVLRASCVQIMALVEHSEWCSRRPKLLTVKSPRSPRAAEGCILRPPKRLPSGFPVNFMASAMRHTIRSPTRDAVGESNAVLGKGMVHREAPFRLSWGILQEVTPPKRDTNTLQQKEMHASSPHSQV